jgi:hypothetical protein
MGRKPELVPNEELVEGVNAGRKTIPFARFDAKRCAQGLEALRSYRVEWDEKARAFKKTPGYNWASHGGRCVALPVALVARADARVGTGEGAGRHPPARPHHGPVYGPRGRARPLRESLASGAMRDRVWDRISRPSQKGPPQQTG